MMKLLACQVGDLDVGQRDTVVVAKVNHCIVAAVYCLKQRLGRAGLCLGQKCLQLIGVGDRCESIQLDRVRACG